MKRFNFSQLNKAQCNALFFAVSFACMGAEASNANSQDAAPLTFGLDADVAVLTNSAVGIDEIDNNSREGDNGTQWELRPNLTWAATERFTVKAAYHFNQLEYQELTEYSSTIGDLTLSARWKTSAGDWGYRLDEVTAQVDGEDFLDLTLHTLDWGKLIAQKYYARLAGVYQQKTFEDLAGRDADTHSAHGQWFWFFNDYQTSFIVAGIYEDEQAQLARHSFDAYQLSGQLTHKWLVAEKQAKFKFGIQIRGSEYQPRTIDPIQPDNTSPILAPETDASTFFIREDEQLKITAEYQQQVWRELSIMALWQYTDHTSNEKSVSYERNLVRLSLGYQF